MKVRTRYQLFLAICLALNAWLWCEGFRMYVPQAALENTLEAWVDLIGYTLGVLLWAVALIYLWVQTMRRLTARAVEQTNEHGEQDRTFS